MVGKVKAKAQWQNVITVMSQKKLGFLAKNARKKKSVTLSRSRQQRPLQN